MTESNIHRIFRDAYDRLTESVTGEINSRNNTGVEEIRGTAFYNSALPHVAENIRCPDCQVHMNRELRRYSVVKCEYHGDSL